MGEECGVTHQSQMLELPLTRWHDWIEVNKCGGSCPLGQSLLRYQPVCLWYHYTARLPTLWPSSLHPWALTPSFSPWLWLAPPNLGHNPSPQPSPLLARDLSHYSSPRPLDSTSLTLAVDKMNSFWAVWKYDLGGGLGLDSASTQLVWTQLVLVQV